VTLLLLLFSLSVLGAVSVSVVGGGERELLNLETDRDALKMKFGP
jgi:hypothetical protein